MSPHTDSETFGGSEAGQKAHPGTEYHELTGSQAHGLTPIHMQWRQGGHAALSQGATLISTCRSTLVKVLGKADAVPSNVSHDSTTLPHSHAGFGIGRREGLCSTTAGRCLVRSRRNPSQQRPTSVQLGGVSGGKATVHGLERGLKHRHGQKPPPLGSDHPPVRLMCPRLSDHVEMAANEEPHGRSVRLSGARTGLRTMCYFQLGNELALPASH